MRLVQSSFLPPPWVTAEDCFSQLLQSSLPYFSNEQVLSPRKTVWDVHNLGNNCILTKLFSNHRNNTLNLSDSSITPRGCFPLIYVLLPLGLSFSHPLSYLQTLKLFMSLRLLHKDLSNEVSQILSLNRCFFSSLLLFQICSTTHEAAPPIISAFQIILRA